jgi:hypothetical protein
MRTLRCSLLLITVSMSLTSSALGANYRDNSSGQGGVPPKDAWTCPTSHPIKGNLTTKTGECIYHVPGGAFYLKTKPELCFSSEGEARQAGCRRSKW